jgi:Fe-S oxidoreductase
MAKMKIEVLAAANRRRGLSLRDRLVAYLPRYAPYASRLAPLMNARDAIPGLPALAERLLGFSAKRPLPRWVRAASALHPDPLPAEERGEEKREVALFADTFNAYFEPENLRAAADVLARLGYRVRYLAPPDGGRPLCCGRTFLSAGLVEEARIEARRVLAATESYLERGVPIVGLEPSCLLTLRDEFLAMLPGDDTERLAAQAFLFEELLARERAADRLPPSIGKSAREVLLHGHCHQKAFGVMGSVQGALALVDGLGVETVDSSCCGMAGAFGYGSETYEASIAMGELSLLPAVRGAPAHAVIAADGFSCRHQIRDRTGREALHVARILRDAMGA